MQKRLSDLLKTSVVPMSESALQCVNCIDSEVDTLIEIPFAEKSDVGVYMNSEHVGNYKVAKVEKIVLFGGFICAKLVGEFMPIYVDFIRPIKNS
jgi:hypothetical protein